jgi:hypothetical protein
MGGESTVNPVWFNGWQTLGHPQEPTVLDKAA